MLSLLRIIAKLPYEAPKQEGLQLGDQYWLHATRPGNVEKILAEGMTGYPEDAEFGYEHMRDEIDMIYGTMPIFVAKNVGLPYIQKMYSGKIDDIDQILYPEGDFVLLQVDVSGLPVVADLMSLDGNYEEENAAITWDDVNHIPTELYQFVVIDEDEWGLMYYIPIEPLITPNSPEAQAAIESTGTAAVLQDIPPDRIKVVG